MDSDRSAAGRPFTPARIVALVLIAIAVLALAYVRVVPGDDPVSVPAGARAGQLTLKPCSYATEDGDYKADCGTLVVPENRADPGSRLIALPLTRIRARSADRRAPVFRLQGGPGVTNTEFPEASRFAAHRDVVLVGYRGVDGSSVLDCPEVSAALRGSGDLLADESARARAAAFRDCAERLRGDGADLAGYSLSERADDLEAARRALGYGRVDLLSESAGTRTAMIYSWRHPAAVGRSVMIGANPPGHFLWDPRATDEQLLRYSDLCARDATCRYRTGDLAASMRHTASDMPGHWLFMPIEPGNVRLASFYGLMDSAPEAEPLSAPETLDAWRAAADGDASGFWFESLMAGLAFPDAVVWGDVAAASRVDVARAERYFAGGGDPGSILGDPGTDFLWGGGRLTTAWPSGPDDDEYDRVLDSDVETLLIGGTVDFATPARFATDELLPHLPNGHQVVLSELGHTTDFWSYQRAAGTRLIETFLDSGAVDESGYKQRRIDFSPGVTHTLLAKGVLSGMVAIALLALVSLLWLPLRVRRRGRLGRASGLLVRTAYTLVLGLGGWFAAALLVLTTRAGIGVTDESLVVLSVGLPIGLGVRWAWVQHAWTRRTRLTGLALATSGALAGAWFGYCATSGILSPLTAIAGACAGANLALVLLDIARDRAREPAALPV